MKNSNLNTELLNKAIQIATEDLKGVPAAENMHFFDGYVWGTYQRLLKEEGWAR